MSKIRLSAALLAGAAAILLPLSADANPQGGNVVGGNASIAQAAGELQVRQTSDRALIEWSSFDIAKGETTHFYQPSSTSFALNRVVNSSQASLINGNLLANGRIAVINPNGVLIGPQGRVDVAGMIASSADIADSDFMEDKLNFSRAGKVDAVVENQGRITVGEAGLAALVAPTVRNSGVIQGNMARVQLAAADTFTVDFYGDGLISFGVETPKAGARNLEATNSGSIVADGGAVLLTAAAANDVVASAINNTGYVQAHGLESVNGEIVLTGEGANVTVSGKLDASGPKSGGKIKIGGDYQGKGTLAQAANVTITEHATIKADATENGNGGTIIAWSTDRTDVKGSFSAKGGSEGGNGGFIETSSKGTLNVENASVDTSAPVGTVGTWLLDPDTINVRTSGVPYTPLPGSGTSDVDVASINNASSTVVLRANNAINFQADVSIINPTVNLVVVAGQSGTDFGMNIGGVYYSLKAGTGTISLANHYIRTVGGFVTFFSGDDITINHATVYMKGVGSNIGGDVTLVSGDISINNNAAIVTNGGDVVIKAFSFGCGSSCKTKGDVTTNSVKIDTTSPLVSSIGGITLTENNAPLPLASYGNPQNVFVQDKTGGSILIKGKTIGGNSVCFAAGGVGCGSDDPTPPTLIDIYADALSKIYGSADPLFTYTYTGSLASGDTFAGALTRVAGENVGFYEILQGSLAISGVGNYTVTYHSNFLNITPAMLTVAAYFQSKVYGDADPALTYGVSGLVNGDDSSVITGALDRDVGENVGSYNINQGTLGAGSNYTINYTGNVLTITPAMLSVVADARHKTYGESDPALGYHESGWKNGDDILLMTGALDRDPGENVGTYNINQGTLSAGSNYTIVYTGNLLTINPARLRVAADPQAKTYGDADPSLTYNVTGLMFSDTADSVLTGALSRHSGENVGHYDILRGSLASNSNYTFFFVGNLLTINPAMLNVLADVQSKVYGDTDPALTYGVSGLKFTDTAADVLEGALDRDTGESVGTYNINQGTLASASDNYVLSYTGNVLTITPAMLSVLADAQSKVYGDADPALTYGVSGFKNGDDSSVVTGALDRDAGENVGSYDINQGTLDAGSNYTINYTGNVLTITPAMLSVLADAQGKIYGDADPALTYGASGFKNGDDSSVLTGALDRDAGENVGSYDINQGTLSAGSNYTISYTGNVLTITPAMLSVLADAQGKIYGDPDPALTYGVSGLKFAETAGDVLTGALDRDAGENVGSYGINQGTLSAGSNYTINYTPNVLTISPARLLVTADGKTKVYGNADPALTYEVYGLKFSDTLSGSLDRDPGENVGLYDITQGTLGAGTNYVLSYKGNVLTITPAVLEVLADPKWKVFGQPDPALTYQASGFKLGDTAATVLTGYLVRDPGEDVGLYEILSGTLAVNANYQMNYTSNVLTISPTALMQAAQTFRINPIGRPIISYDDNVIMQHLPFRPYDVQTTNTNVSIKASGLAAAGGLNALQPAAGGNSPEDLGALEPAAGGNSGPTDTAENAAVACGNNFLDNRPCDLVQ